MAVRCSLWWLLDMAGKRTLAWLIYFAMVAGAFAAVWFIVQDDDEEEGQRSFLDTYGPVIVFSFINGGLPWPIKQLPLLEHYKHPRTEMQVSAGNREEAKDSAAGVSC
jgi:hypothetical protein